MRRSPFQNTSVTYHRAVFREADGLLYVNRFDRGGACRGWYYATGAALPPGVALASLEITTDEDSGDREVLVRFKFDSDTPAARERITRWARSVGHTRLWFADDYVDLTLLPAPAASVGRCHVCETTFREEGADFHEEVRRTGAHPWTCPVCGAAMAAWEVEDVGFDP
ncbi:hypothetical protein [Paraconexibacter sp.]|uniref:hypothetical protein n=1 Tax=Paraconexibacter sp. TaxID=2949640 RepID=UPI003564CC73